MKLTLNHVSVLTASGVLAVGLIILSFLYFHAKPVPVQHPSVTRTIVSPKPQKLTLEEIEQRNLEKEAQRLGKSVKEVQNAARKPEKLIERELELQKDQNPEEQMSHLIHKRRQLEKIPQAHVEQVTCFLENSLETHSNREMENRKEVEPQDFDADSAQIDDCERVEKEGGGFRYIATLADVKGNTMKVELNESEGLQTWRTMQMLKNNPLMDAIYRKTVIPLLEKKIK